MIKGDTAYLKVEIHQENGNIYELQKGDTLTFSMKKNLRDETYTLQKITDKDGAFVLQAEDTENLICGKYYYDVQLNTANNEVFTVVETSEFYLKEGVTE